MEEVLTLITDSCTLCSSRGRDRQGPAPLPQPALPERLGGPRAAADHTGQPLPPHRPLWVTLSSPYLPLHLCHLSSPPWVKRLWYFSLLLRLNYQSCEVDRPPGAPKGPDSLCGNLFVVIWFGYNTVRLVRDRLKLKQLVPRYVSICYVLFICI